MKIACTLENTYRRNRQKHKRRLLTQESLSGVTSFSKKTLAGSSGTQDCPTIQLQALFNQHVMISTRQSPPRRRKYSIKTSVAKNKGHDHAAVCSPDGLIRADDGKTCRTSKTRAKRRASPPRYNPTDCR